MLKENKGITLVALVVTIIVLLILAGVSIAMIGGENGILGKASSAKTSNAKAEANGAMAMAVQEAMTNHYAGDTDQLTAANVASLASHYTQNFTFTASSNSITVTDNSDSTNTHTYSLTINSNSITFTNWS